MRQCLRYAASTAVLLALASPALAVQDCKPAKADNRVCSVVFNPDDVVRVWGTLRSLTLFEFSPDEAVTKVSAADRNDLIMMPLQNTVILKPKPLPSAAWALQPIVIQTTRKDGSVRSYLVEYNLRDGGSLQAGDQYTQFAVKSPTLATWLLRRPQHGGLDRQGCKPRRPSRGWPRPARDQAPAARALPATMLNSMTPSILSASSRHGSATTASQPS